MLFMGSISTLIYASELILCSTITLSTYFIKLRGELMEWNRKSLVAGTIHNDSLTSFLLFIEALF